MIYQQGGGSGLARQCETAASGRNINEMAVFWGDYEGFGIEWCSFCFTYLPGTHFAAP
jgi:hypothetical protein